MNNRKRSCLIVLCLMMLFAYSTCAFAKPSMSKVKKAYTDYINQNQEQIKKNLKSIGINYFSPTMFYLDMNRDGVQELFYRPGAGIRPVWYIFTYKKGKVIMAGEEYAYISYNKKWKMIRADRSAPFGMHYIIYKLKGSKLRSIADCIENDSGCYINTNGHSSSITATGEGEWKKKNRKKFEKMTAKYNTSDWKSLS